jgi:hypothetical protein
MELLRAYPPPGKIRMSGAIPCGLNGVQDVVEAAVTPGSSSLTDHAPADRYVHIWRTSKDWAHSCRQLILKLSGGSVLWAQANIKELAEDAAVYMHRSVATQSRPG